MKKTVSLILCIVLLCSCFCFASAEGGLKLGIAIVTDNAASASATADADGLNSSDITVAAVLLDENGVIVNCLIDCIQPRVNFNAKGEIVTESGTTFKSKMIKQEEYGMRKASAIGKEWFEQARFFCDYCIGKTADAISGIALDTANGGSKPTDADITAGCTINVGDFIEAVTAACAGAEETGAKATDAFKLCTLTKESSSKAATADANGNAEADACCVAVTIDENGVYTACALDVVQSKLAFDATGAIVGEVKRPVSKKVLQDGYGMRNASPIGKEWFEQAAFFTAYVTGKTIDEVQGIAVEGGKPTDADLTAGCTISIADFLTVLSFTKY